MPLQVDLTGQCTWLQHTHPHTTILLLTRVYYTSANHDSFPYLTPASATMSSSLNVNASAFVPKLPASVPTGTKNTGGQPKHQNAAPMKPNKRFVGKGKARATPRPLTPPFAHGFPAWADPKLLRDAELDKRKEQMRRKAQEMKHDERNEKGHEDTQKDLTRRERRQRYQDRVNENRAIERGPKTEENRKRRLAQRNANWAAAAPTSKNKLAMQATAPAFTPSPGLQATAPAFQPTSQALYPTAMPFRPSQQPLRATTRMPGEGTAWPAQHGGGGFVPPRGRMGW